MQWASAISQKRALPAAVSELETTLRGQIGSAAPDLIVAFFSPHFHDSYEALIDLVHERFAPGALLGCSAAGVIGGGVEVEHRPALSLTAACLPGVKVQPFHVETGELPGMDDEPSAWEEALGVRPRPAPHFIILADPFTFEPRNLLMGMDFAYPGGSKIGGLASAGGNNVLCLDRELYTSGAAGIALQGNIKVDTIVAQGCRPIGSPMTVTGCEQNWLLELDRRNPMAVLTDIYHTLNPRDRELMQHSLHVGIASTELQEVFGPGDFLIRGVMGVDQKKGSLAVGESLRSGQTIQFHLRDAETASEDLDLVLSRYRSTVPQTQPAGALLFSCTGRGEYLYGKPNHDSEAVIRAMGDLPLGGFFCAGEIGPVACSTHLHGFTSSIGIFRPFTDGGAGGAS